MSEIKLSGTMHCWLMAKVEVGGNTYIALRGVNWCGEYDKANAHAPVGHPWWHVPTSKFQYDPKYGAPDVRDVLETAMPQVYDEWPALIQQRIFAVDQDITGKWGGFNAKAEAETVTRIAIDFGVADALPNILLKPGQKLPWPRHPVTWVDVDSVVTVSSRHFAVKGRQTLNVEVWPGETKTGFRAAKVANLPFQDTVATMFEKAFGNIFDTISLGTFSQLKPALMMRRPGQLTLVKLQEKIP